MPATITPWELRLQAAPPVPRVHHPKQRRRPRQRRGQRQAARRRSRPGAPMSGLVFYVRPLGGHDNGSGIAEVLAAYGQVLATVFKM